MPFEFGDQPNYYTTALMPRYWDLCSADMTVAPGDGYAGANGWTASGDGAYAVRYPEGVDRSAFGFVVRLYIDSLPGSEAIILAAVEAPDGGSPTAPRVQVSAVLNPDGTMSIYRGDVSGTLLATSTDTIPTLVHARIGFSGVIDPVNGSAKVWMGVDGSPDQPLEPIAQVGGVSTDPVGTGERRGVYMGGTPDLVTSYLYTQGGGTLPNKPKADIQFPDADTDLHDWGEEPGGSSLASEINEETAADDDTSFAFSSAVNESFAVTHETVPERGLILGVRLVATVANDASVPTMTYTPLMRSSGGVISLGPLRSTTPDWRGVDLSASVDPFSGLPWTPSVIDGTGWGGRTTP